MASFSRLLPPEPLPVGNGCVGTVGAAVLILEGHIQKKLEGATLASPDAWLCRVPDGLVTPLGSGSEGT